MYRKSCVGGLITEPGPQRGALRQLSLRLEVRFTVLKEIAGVRNGANNRKDVGTWNFGGRVGMIGHRNFVGRGGILYPRI